MSAIARRTLAAESANLADGVADSRVVARVDLNVPLDGRAIADDARLRAALPTLRALAARGNRVLVVAHLRRPRAVEPGASLAPVAVALARLLGVDVPLVHSHHEWVRSPTRLALHENIRFDPRETSRSVAARRALAAELRAGADVVVSDAFAAFHRRHASIVELVESGPSALGELVASELAALASLRAPAEPLVVIVGGTRVEEKLALLERLTTRGATVALGAQMAAGLAALAATDDPAAPAAQRVLTSDRAVIPTDVRVEDDAGGTRVVSFQDLRPDMRTIDLGPWACRCYAELVHEAGTLVWNGPPGYQHERAGCHGAEALATACAASQAVTIVGGGTTSMPLRRLGLAERVTHVSTGGTVLLHLLLDLPLPGLEALHHARAARRARTATTSSTAAAARR